MSKTLFRGIAPGIMIERIFREEAFAMPALHFHNEYEIYYLYEGNRQYVIDNKYYDLSKGSLAFINKQEAHKTLSTPVPTHERILIEFHEAHFSEFLFSVFGLSLADFFNANCGVIHLDEVGQNHIENLFWQMQQEFQTAEFAYERSIMLRISEIILYIHRLNSNHRVRLVTSPQSDKKRLIEEIRSYIASPEGRFSDLTEISAKFYLNKSYLSRIYKEITGLTVHEYINIRRIKYSQNLLINSTKSVEEIAIESGFQSLTYFERVFRKHTDTSPLKYRKRIKQIIQNTRNPDS